MISVSHKKMCSFCHMDSKASVKINLFPLGINLDGTVYIWSKLLHSPTCVLLNVESAWSFHRLSCGGKSDPPSSFIPDFFWSLAPAREWEKETWSLTYFSQLVQTYKSSLYLSLELCLSILCQRSLHSPLQEMEQMAPLGLQLYWGHNPNLVTGYCKIDNYWLL